MTIRKTDRPHSRLTELIGEMADAAEASELYTESVQIVVMMRDGEDCGIGLRGYTDELAAIPDVFTHVRAMLRLNGQDLDVIAVPQKGQG